VRARRPDAVVSDIAMPRPRDQLFHHEDRARFERVDDTTLRFEGGHGFGDLRDQINGARQRKQTFLCYQILERANSLLVGHWDPFRSV